MTKSKLLATSALGMAALLTGTAQAQNVGTELVDAVTGGKVHLELRPRYEHVKDDAVSKDANAFTMRSVLGYQTGLFYGFSAYGEFDNVSQFGGAAFNDTVNGKTNRAVVADPKDTRVSQIYLKYQVPPGAYGRDPNHYLDGTSVAFGRQNINLVDVRWIGDVGWRQTRQMYDGATVTYDFKPIGLNFEYNYFYNVDRIFGQNSPNSDISLNAHLVTLDLGLENLIRIPAHLIGYAYLFDFDSGQPVPESGTLSGQDSSKASNKVFGVRLDGKYPLTDRLQLLYTGEYANQSDYDNGSSVIDANYILGTLGVNFSGITLSGNYELLGSNNGKYALQTTFATGHKWNGWADRFLTTPADGLQDFWAQAAAVSPANWGPALGGIKLDSRYHRFESDHGSTHYGDEFDIAVSKKVTPELAFLVKFAQYWGNNGGGSLSKDTQKYWVQADYKF